MRDPSSSAPLRVPHRRRLRIGPVRLRPAAASARRAASRARVESSSTCAGTRVEVSVLPTRSPAYAVQDTGADTVDAQVELGLPVDARDYSRGSGDPARPRCARRSGCSPTTPTRSRPSRAAGIDVAAVERLQVAPVATNAAYLRTKRDRLGHDLVLDAHDPRRPAHEAGGALTSTADGSGPAGRHRRRLLAHGRDGRARRRSRRGSRRGRRARRPRRPSAGHRGALRRVRPAGAGIRRAGRARGRHPRWHTALRLRLQRGHPRPHRRERPHRSPDRLRGPHLRRRPSRPSTGPGCRGRARTRVRRQPWPPSRPPSPLRDLAPRTLGA